MMQKTFMVVNSALAVLVFVAGASATSVSFRDTTTSGNSTAATDTFLRKDTPDVNVGVTSSGSMGGAGDRWYPPAATRERHSMYWFDLASVKAGLQPGEYIQVNSATFSLWLQEGSDMTKGATWQGNLSRVLGSWIEGTSIGAGVNPGEPTWNHRVYNTAAWQTAGATGANDKDMTLTFTVQPPDATGNIFRQDIGVTNIVKSWLETGNTNNGFLLHGGTWTSTASFACYMVASNEYTGDINRRPLLAIDYTVLPEPTALVLLGIGGLLALRRRR